MASGRRSSATSAGVAAGRISSGGRELLFRSTIKAVMVEIALASTRQLTAVRTGWSRTFFITSSFGPERAQPPCIDHGDMIDGV